MSMRRAAPGTQVSQGRLRVDAARALKKLREYQLADPAAWVLEGIRAAVASGATKIELRGDSNDIWLGWHGTPWDSELLPRLFDELVSPEVSDEKQHVRLLAAAVNSGLGMNPAYVDVYSITAEGKAKRARFTPEVLAEPENELGEAALRHVAIEDAEPPLAIMSGMLVHLRRRTSLGLLAYWIGEPPELPLARANCRDLGVPITIDGDHTARKDLFRVPLEDGMRGFIAITDRQLVGEDACFEVAERGVVLARYPLQVLGFSSKQLAHKMAIRVFLDADRLPTNVARSQVRRDVHPIATAERRVRTLIPDVIKKLVEAYGDGTGEKAAHARFAAFTLLAAAVAGHPVGWRHVPELLKPLAALPLVKNAFGKPKVVSSEFVSEIYSEKSALPAELEQWIRECLWAPPDDDVRILLGGFLVDVTSMRRHVRAARQQHRAHKKFLAHKKREIKVQTTMRPRVRVSLGVKVDRSMVPADWFTDTNGEVCIYDRTQNAAVVFCTEGRELERVELASTIPFDAVIDSPMLSPGERYRGVLRDGAFGRVERAMRAGVLRALEWHVAEGDVNVDADLSLVRAALVLAKDMNLEISGPLALQGAWRTSDGGLASYDDLTKSRYIGVIGEEQSLVAPAGRKIVHANGETREELRRLFGQKVVSYHKAVDAKPVTREKLASLLPHSGRTACLTLEADGVLGAICFDSQPSLTLTHRGIDLGSRVYNSQLVRCSIVVDSDAIVPNEKWTKAMDDAKLGERSYLDWELALIRAIAARVTGADTPNLLAPEGEIDANDANFALLADVLLVKTPVEILEKPLLDRLCTWPLFRRTGQTQMLSINDIADWDKHNVYYVTEDMPVLDQGFLPIVTTEKNAKLIGKLGRRAVYDGKPEMQRRQRMALKRQRIDDHLAKPESPAELRSELPVIGFTGKIVRGYLGLTELRPDVRIHVENRLFHVAHPELGYPVAAAVDLAMEHCNESFDGISNLSIQEIGEDILRAIPDLIEAIAKDKPRLLGEPGPARRLLSQYLAGGQITPELRKLLRTVAAFRTIQGEYRSIESVEDPPEYLPIAAFGDEWLPVEEGENPTPYDGPILRVAKPVDELHSIIGKLHADAVTDVTVEVLRVQARRRMARGLLPTPKLVGVPEIYKKPLKEFGELTKKLGHGEAGFAMSPVASLLIHEQGQLVRTIDVDVMPAILLAIEEPHTAYDYAQMTRIAQDIAVELVRIGLPESPPAELRRNLARAVLSRRVPPAAVGSTELFQRVDGSWIDWKTFQAQLDKFDDVWALTTPTLVAEPLDAERFVLDMTSTDIELAVKNGFQIINAKVELELDAKTRINKARRRANNLELPVRAGVMAEVELEGDGKSSPRGRVAVLYPQYVRSRSLVAHKAMHPFDAMEDVCRWPTIAVIDDARITPDRTWSQPKSDDTWAAVTKDVRAASEEALAKLGEVPGDAHAEIRVTSHVCSDVKALREAPRSLIRGVVWLGAVPYTPLSISYHHEAGTRGFVAPSGLALGGQLAVYKAPGDELDVGKALEQLAVICHGKLVRMAMKDSDLDRDVVAAHVAHALAEQTIKPTEVSGLKFTCFAPRPIEARQLAGIFRRNDPISIVKKGTTDIAETAFVDDGSELAKVVRAHLGDRITKRGPPPKPAPPPPPTNPPVSTVRPAPIVHEAPKAPPPEKPKPPPKPAKPHVLQPLVDELSKRVAKLGIATVRWSIIPDTEPMFDISDLEIRVAGDNARLRLIASELLADSILAGSSIDALAAHVVSVLNIARQDITDATEMHALGVLLATPPSADRPQSRRSS